MALARALRPRYQRRMESVTISRLGHQGDGIARHLDSDLFVPQALPGEIWTGNVQDKALCAADLVQASPDRVAPPCPQFGTCGGCALQHASDDLVARWKAAQVETALSHVGIRAQVRAVHTSPPASRRRATFAARRGRKGVQIGFHARGSDRIVPIDGCTVLHPALITTLPALADLARIGASRAGVLALSVTLSDAGPDVQVSGGKTVDAALSADLAALAGRAGWARLAWNTEVLALLRPPGQAMGPARVVPPPGAFLQATVQGELALVQAMRGALAGATRIADLFAGCGTFALPLSQQAQVHAVEGQAESLAALDRGWREAAGSGLRRLSTETRDLFRRPLLPAELDRHDALVIDPPRAGAEAQMTQIARSGVGLVGSVSCNPASFARDTRILCDAGFGLDWIEVVDQFRWSGHVEIAARLSR